MALQTAIVALLFFAFASVPLSWLIMRGPGFSIVAFAARVLQSALDLWVQASLDQRQRPQQLFLLTVWCSMENGLFEPV
jgi:hypothetical protein